MYVKLPARSLVRAARRKAERLRMAIHMFRSKVRRIFAILLVVSFALSGQGHTSGTSVATADAPVAANWDYRGFSIIAGHDVELYTDDGAYLERMARTGANTVTIVFLCYMQSVTSTSFICDQRTATDDSLIWATRKARSLGLKVIFKPHVDVADANNTWRAEIQPADPNEWFVNYTNLIVHYADLLRDAGGTGMIIGTELISMSTNPAYESKWRALIATLRARWKAGILSYSANWGGSDATEEWSKVPFWDALDYLGLSAYFRLADTNTPTVDSILNSPPDNTNYMGWNQWYSQKLLPFQQKWNNKPFLFTEVGYRDVDWAAVNPFDNWSPYPLDYTEQSYLYAALHQFWWNKPNFAGSLFWLWDFKPTPPDDTGYSPENKPAASDVLYPWWRPKPSIYDLSQEVANAGDAGFTIAIKGEGFMKYVTTLRWAGADRPTNVINTTLLTSTIPASDIAAVRNVTVTVSNLKPGLDQSNTWPFKVQSKPAPPGAANVTVQAPTSGQKFSTARFPTPFGDVVFIFENPSGAGNVSVTPWTDAPTEGQPAGYRTLRTSYRLSSSGFTYTAAQICLTPDQLETYAANLQPIDVRVLNFSSNAWNDATQGVGADPISGTLCGRVTTLSSIVLGAANGTARSLVFIAASPRS
jgi:hypothetical protein